MSELDGLKLLRRIEEGVAGKTGEAFFRQIVRDLAGALDAHAAFSSRLLPERRARMLAFWVAGHYDQCLEYALVGTPCEWVYRGEITAFARDVGEAFPIDREWFRQLGGITSYLGIPVVDESGEVCGHLAVLDVRERDWRDADVDTLRLFSLRAAAELERFRHQERLGDANAALHAANEQLRSEIERRRIVEAELAAAKVAAEAANQAKSAFISNMSHELRTPLNGILGYAQLLRRSGEKLSETQLDGLSVIERSGEHLLNLVNDLLDIARIEAGRMELRNDVVDLRELLRDVSDLARVRAQHAELSFTFAAAPALPAQIVGDARALRQILLNLLGNAVKFTEPGGSVRLDVDAEPCGEGRHRLRIVVEDSGIGIPDDEIERVFEPFHRIERGDRTVEGTGLGLTITSRLVAAMGGRIELDSHLGEGTCFAIKLEVEQAPARRAERRHTGDIMGYEGPRRRVLVADDDAVNRDLVSELLLGLGFEVSTAANGLEALQLMRLAPPDLLVTDLVMPMLDGMLLVRTLRADATLHAVPVLALSASASEYTRQEALQGGCDAFLPKPMRLSAVLDEIQRLLGVTWQSRSADAHTPWAQAGVAVAPAYALDAAVATELYHLAMQGDITALLARADATLGRDPAARPLYEQIRALARDYDTGAIRRALTAHANER